MADPMSSPLILFIDDDADVQRAAAMLLARHDLRLLCASSPDAAWSVLAAERVDVVLLDLNFSRGATSGQEGLAMLRALVAHDPDAVVVVVTGHSGIAIAVAAMRAGATDFVMKPWGNEKLLQTLAQAAELRSRRRLAHAAPAGPPAAPVVGQSPAWLRVMAMLQRVAPTQAPVLLAGERGTGKTLLAQAIHRLSPHAGTDMITRDADADEAEIDALPASGTVLLEEPGGLPARLQARLQRALEAAPGLRVITTTRLPAPEYGLQVDLFARIATIQIRLPALAERAGDAALLAHHFTGQFALAYGRPGLSLSPEAAALAAAWPWPGQVRELRQAIERAVVLAAGPVLNLADIQPVLPGTGTPMVEPGDLNLARSEKAVVEAALRRHAFNVSHAARELGLTRAALYRRMARHGL